tara:strand:+ start:6146 stop:7006 length:861 start_codon:yes stop_codon:yes gene_type:complete
MKIIHVDNRGLKLRVIHNPSSNPKATPILMTTPGWGWSAEGYVGTLGYLAEDYDFYFLDTRGSGGSDAPPSIEDYQFYHFAEDFECVRKAFGLEKLNFVGHSYGGVLGMHYALQFPESIEKLIILCSYMGKDDQYVKAYEKAMDQKKQEAWYVDVKSYQELKNVDESQEKLENWLDGLLPLYFSDQSALKQNRELLAQATIRLEPFKGSLHCCPNWDAGLYEAVKAIKTETHIICGEEDFVCPESENRRIHESIKDSKLTTIPGVGHFPWIEKPKEFKKAFDSIFR